MEWYEDFSLVSVFASPWPGFHALLVGLLLLAMSFCYDSMLLYTHTPRFST
jgi:hypothetical protein